MVDGLGVPLSLVVTGAHRHDMKSVSAVLREIVVPRPEPTQVSQNLCVDKGYDYEITRREIEAAGYTPHIKARGVEAEELNRIPGAKARRWVVEAAHGWFNRFRKLLVRFEKKVQNHLALLHLAAAAIAFRHVKPCSKRDGMILG